MLKCDACGFGHRTGDELRACHATVIIDRARRAVTELRDATREGRVLDHHKRDPLVVAIHDALDLLERRSAHAESTEKETRDV